MELPAPSRTRVGSPSHHGGDEVAVGVDSKGPTHDDRGNGGLETAAQGVLLIDDNLSQLELYAAGFTLASYTVTTALGGSKRARVSTEAECLPRGADCN